MQEMQQNRVQSLGQEDPLEEMSTHFFTHAGKIPYTAHGVPKNQKQPSTHACTIGIWQHLSNIFVYISMITTDVGHLFMCLFATCISSLINCLKVFGSFLIGLFVFLLLSFKSSLHNWVTDHYWMSPVQIVDSPSMWLIF